MTSVRLAIVGAAAVAVGSSLGCGPRAVAISPGRPELIVLLAEPGGGAIGRAIVSNAAGSVELVAARDSTLVIRNQAPGAVTSLSEAAVQKRFGEALQAQPPPPRVFTLYFLFDSDELTNESRSLVTTILAAVREHPAPDVVAVGHTDTTGTSDANFTLGGRRAATIRNVFVAAGLDPSLIEVMSLGERDLLVQTPDETPEPRNRRVEVAIR